MCGITGYFDSNLNRKHLTPIIHKMTDIIDYRGPDADGFFVEDGIALGHRRLSIIDLSSGAQPMANKKQSVWIVFNGEIYNFPEIRDEFEKEGYRFQTHSDTEVLIALYEKYGEEMLPRINGMFAFAIWDARKRKLFLARDRMGKKPLFYFQKGKMLIFGSEMKSILAAGKIPRELSPQALDMFFSFGFVPAPYTILKDIQKLLPGYYMVFSENEQRIVQYWDVKFDPVPMDTSRSKMEDRLDELLYNAVTRRLISDVPLGAFLSGGVDSSSVVGLMARYNKIPVESFTIDFDEGDYSEAADARVVAEYFKTNHHELTVKPSSFDILQDAVWHFDEPFGDSSAIPTYYVSKMARENVTVILSGDGGDELFAGYSRYMRMDQLKGFENVPSWIKKYLLAPFADVLPLNFPARNRIMAIAHQNNSDFGLGIYPYIKQLIFSGDMKRLVKQTPLSLHSFPHIASLQGMHPLSRKQYLDIKLYLPDDILVKVDKMSMANSLETRAPLLDYTLAEFAATLPPQWHVENNEGKAFLKKVVGRFLPEHVFNKAKHGFSIPKKTWFKAELKDFSNQVLLNERARQRGVLDSRMVEKILHLHNTGERDYSKWIWCLLNLELWFKTFIDADTRRI